MNRPHYDEALLRLGILQALAAYDPHVAGTPPLGVDTPQSDIDILCCAPDMAQFFRDVVALYSALPGFSCWQWVSGERPLIVNFTLHGWEFELFASPQPVEQQAGWRHFTIERRLLGLGGETFKTKVMSLRSEGYKTEPAFWAALEMQGNAYAGLLKLCDDTDEALVDRLKQAGFS